MLSKRLDFTLKKAEDTNNSTVKNLKKNMKSPPKNQNSKASVNFEISSMDTSKRGTHSGE